MPAVNSPPDDHALQTNWASQEDQTMSSRDQNPASMPVDDEHTPNHNAQDPESSADRDYPPRGSSVDASVNGSKADNYRGEKQVKVLLFPPAFYPCICASRCFTTALLVSG